MDPYFDYQFRLILIGDSTVGKSSLLKYFTDGKFAELSDPTVGVDFFARHVQFTDPQTNKPVRIKLQLWDTAGQERFQSITRSYYKNSVGALLVYDVCNRNSFESIPRWMMEAKRHIDPHEPVFVLVGCKLDLAKMEREVPLEDVREFANCNNIRFVETSSKNGLNVEEAFTCITKEIYEKIQSGGLQVKEGWDGIKPGSVLLQQTPYHFAEGESAKTPCC